MSRRRILALVAILLVLAGLIGLVGLLGSESILRWTVARATSAHPGLEMTGVSGKLISGISVEQLRWRGESGAEVVVQGARAEWRFLPALAGRLNIPLVTADSVAITHAPPAPGSPPRVATAPAAFDPPFVLRIATLKIRRLTLDDGASMSATLSDIEGDALSLVNGTLTVGRLVAAGDPVSFDLQGSLQMRGHWAVDSEMTWRYADPDWPTVHGETRLSGDRRVLQLEQSLTSPAGSLTLSGAVSDAFTSPDFKGVAHLRALHPSRIRPDWPQAVLASELELEGWIEDLSAAGVIRVSLPGIPEVAMQLRAEWGDALLVVRESSVRVAGMDTRFGMRGRVDWSEPQPIMRATIDWTDVQWPLEGDADLRSSRGELSLEADSGQYTLVGGGQVGARDTGQVSLRLTSDWLEFQDRPVGQVEARWNDIEIGEWHIGSGQADMTVDLDGVTAPDIRIITPGGDIHADAKLAWRDALQLEARVTATDLDASAIHAHWPDRLNLVVDGWAVRDGDALDWTVDGRFDSGEASLHIQAKDTSEFDLAWTLDAPDLSALFAGAGGSLRSHGRLSGDPAAPYAEFELAGVAIAWGGRTIDRVDMTLSGAHDALTLTVDAEREALSANLRLVGAWREGHFDGTLREASLTHEGEPSWVLQSPAGVAAGRDGARLDEACWSQVDSGGHVCTGGGWVRGATTRFAASINALPLAALDWWMPFGFIYEGTLSGDALLEGTAGSTPTVTATFSLSPGTLQQGVREETVTLLAWREATLAGTLADGDLAAQFGFALVDGGHLRGDLNLPVLETEAGEPDERPMRAHIVGNFSDFDLVPAFFPEIGAVSGRVNVDLRADGSLRNPTFGGRLAIADGTASIPRLGIVLSGMGLDIEGARDIVSLRAEASSGPGQVTLQGRFTIKDGKASGQGRLNGESFLVADFPEAHVLMTPALNLTFEGRDVHLEGTLGVPMARIAPGDFTAAVKVSEDQILVDGGAHGEPESGWRISSRIRLNLGDDVRFSGYGLVARIAGNVTVTENVDQVTLATGELLIMDGRYRAWGQQLDIERGRLIYSGGPVTRPGLDIRAVRRPRDILVGVNIRGTLAFPELTLFSEPPMPQSEALSWLILGQPLRQAGGSEQELVDRTSNELGLAAGGGLLLGQLTRRLGLENVDIERGGSPEDTLLVIGHYLSPRLYVSYGIGLFEPGNTVRMRYQLDRSWSLEAESGERATGADLLYNIERD